MNIKIEEYDAAIIESWREFDILVEYPERGKKLEILEYIRGIVLILTVCAMILLPDDGIAANQRKRRIQNSRSQCTSDNWKHDIWKN